MKKNADGKEPAELDADGQYSSALIAGICDALKIIGHVLAEDEGSRSLLKQSYEAFMAAAPQRLGLSDQHSPLLMAGYKDGLGQIAHGLQARDAKVEVPAKVH
ncbi:hypothetical protein [Pseudomonas sp. 8Z]|uniref:hypothetical protein n=1 Tax=Pseudomonas sp. 8Z TaxID=2653166 RepID=UPI001357114A|nr:hypothetical protein [Pseudomonas sp. 8Z]